LKSTITHSKRAMGAALTATALVASLAAMSVPAAQAADAKAASAHSTAVSNASLTWKISDCAFTACGSLAQAQSVTGNVTKAADGFKFTGGTGTIDQLTGALSIAYTGSATIGNTNQGGFSVTLTDPVITVDAQGSGSLAADASFKTSPTAAPTTANDVIVVSLPKVTPSTTFTVTPPWAGVGVPAVPAPVEGKQFAQSFMSVVPDALKGFFWATGTTGSNLTKAPSPVTVQYDRAWKPTLIVRPAKVQNSKTVTTLNIVGVGFDPSKAGPTVQGLYVAFGPNPATTPNGYKAVGGYGASNYVSSGPDALGRFVSSLKVTGVYKTESGTIINGVKQVVGVSSWAAHTHAITNWDAFTQVKFTK